MLAEQLPQSRAVVPATFAVAAALPTGACRPFLAGWGDFGRLGTGDCKDVFIPAPVPALSGRSVVGVACGDTHTLVVVDSGELFAFGRNQVRAAAGSGATASQQASQQASQACAASMSARGSGLGLPAYQHADG